jgi:hypothetical protein
MATEKTLLEREFEVLSKALQELRPDIDMDNVRKIAEKVNMSWRTVLRYLEGDVAKIDTAKEIIAACRKNIIEREQKLKQHSTAA